MGKGSTATRGWKRVLSLAAVLALLAAFSVTARKASALTYNAIYTVNTFADTHNTGGTNCSDLHGKCSLRAASEAADAWAPGSTILINVPGGTYLLTLGPLLFKTNTIYVYGAGRTQTIVQSNGNGRVIENGTPGILAPTDAANLTLQDMTITGGDATNPPASDTSNVFDGGGVLNSGNLSLIRVHITKNYAANGGGVAIIGDDSFYPTTITDSTIDYNEAIDTTALDGDGGGILNTQTLTLRNDHVDHNTAVSFAIDPPAEGGGVYSSNHLTSYKGTFNSNQAIAYSGILRSAASIRTVKKNILSFIGSQSTDSKGGAIFNTDNNSQVANAEISGNGAGQGGGIYNQHQLTLTNDSLASNQAGCAGGGTFNPPALTTFDDTPTLTMTSVMFWNNTVGWANTPNAITTICLDKFNSTLGYFPRPMTGAGSYNDGIETITGAIYERNHFVNTQFLSSQTGLKTTSDGYLNLCGVEYTCGGGLYAGGFGTIGSVNSNSQDTLTGTRFVGNQANGGNGGAIFEGEGSLTIQNGAFAGNRATFDGGAIFDDYSYETLFNGTAHVVLTNTYIQGNIAGDTGGGIWNLLYGQVLINGGTLISNQAPYCPNWYNGAIMTGGTCS